LKVASGVARFADFELDSGRFQLRKGDLVLKLEGIPMELLTLLVESNGQLVSRDQIIEKIWGKGVFLDTEHGINTAIRKIRLALHDDPEKPHFVETVTGRGYRFIAPVLAVPANGNGNSGVALESSPGALSVTGPPSSSAAASPMPPIQSLPPVLRPTNTPLYDLPTTTTHKSPLVGFLAATLAVILVIFGLMFGFNGLGLRDRLWPGNAKPHIHSLAVLPLENLSGDPSQDYFSDGMTDELITTLAKNTDLRIVSRTSAMQYKGVHRPLPEIARELHVDGILEGSVERSSNRVHMNVQLVYAPTDSHIWAESYDRDLNQAFLLPSELTQTVAKEVQVKTSNVAARPARYVSPEAHEAYLHGRYFWFTFDVGQTLPYFEKAIQLQPDYAAAWSGLADSYDVAGMTGFLRPFDALPKTKVAAGKAIELDDSLPEAHNSMAAWYLFYGWDPLRADEECRRAIALNPNYAEVHYLRHYVMLAMDRPEEATVEEKRAVELDQYSRAWGLGGFYLALGKYDAAIDELRFQSQARPGDPWVRWTLGEAYWLKGMYEQSEQEFEKSYELQGLPKMAAAAHKVWIKGGEKAFGQWTANNLKTRARKEYVLSWDLAAAQAYTGDKDETLKYLEAAYREHAPNLITVQYEAIFYFLHDDPRFIALVQKIRLPRNN
jgi:TolB-like protein/DNA-binding winged helix-turn-helix (wHTH) protein